MIDGRPWNAWKPYLKKSPTTRGTDGLMTTRRGIKASQLLMITAQYQILKDKRRTSNGQHRIANKVLCLFL